MSEIGNTVSWSPALEQYFSETGEKANCLSWIHKKAEELYSTRKTFIDLPVIIGSAAIAFLNAGSSTLFEDPKLSSISLGVGSLVLGVLNSIGTYFGWSRRAEGHRIASIQYGKLYRFLQIEMSLPRDERMSSADLLKYTKESYDRLQEISPLIPPEVAAMFKSRFSKYKDISKPVEVNGLEKIVVFQEPPSHLKIRVPLSSHQLEPEGKQSQSRSLFAIGRQDSLSELEMMSSPRRDSDQQSEEAKISLAPTVSASGQPI